MDNMSRRHSGEDTTSSMYLSFDAESTMSTACYKTLEAMSDMSVLSSIDMNQSVNRNTDDNQMNMTLELEEKYLDISALKTVKKNEISDAKMNSPLKVLPKNIIKEYKALCSTPSREMLLKSVDLTRGSDAMRCVDLGLAFLGVDDEKPAYFPPLSLGLHDENKENILPDTEEMSTLSTCSVEITNTVIEKKMLSSISTVGSVVEVECVEDKNSNEAPMDIVDECSKTRAVFDDATNAMPTEKENFSMNFNEENSETTAKAKNEDIKCIESLKIITDITSLVKELKIEGQNTEEKSVKPKIPVLTESARRSVCKPNLDSNKKPSKNIDSDNKRRSFLPTSKKPIINVDAENEIPFLMSKILKITNTAMKTEQNDIPKNYKLTKNLKNYTPAEKEHSATSSMKKRTSLIPSAPGYKRPFSYNQRMSVVVKTTLNSPARKIARKSSVSGLASSSTRRSIIPQKFTSTDNSQVKKPEILSCKGFVPKSSGINMNTNTSNSLPDTFKKPNTNGQRKSLYIPGNVSEKCKPDISYTCNVCRENFRIKSLLDAHKRSHETDNKPPAFVKKPLTKVQPGSGAVHGNSNQCKYCDKKFALLKALHIHLLQNCSKIPPSEKRKLEYTELNHVEKAQLPVFTQQNMQNNVVSSTNITPRYTLKPNTVISSSESINENKETQKITSNLITANGNNGIASQATICKPKKITAHAGVYRTPSKSVPCHLCKVTFKSILDYTNHNLSTHGSYKADATDNTGKVKENISSHNN